MKTSGLRLLALLFVLPVIVTSLGCGAVVEVGNAGTWHLYAISLSYAGPKDYDMQQAGITSRLELYPDGTAFYTLSSPGHAEASPGTWGYGAGKYTFTNDTGESTIFREDGSDLYVVGQTTGGQPAWLWYR